MGESEVYVNQATLGWLFRVTSHIIGRALKQEGLRLPNRKPSPRAFQLGMVKKEPIPGQKTLDYWVWHLEKTIPHLESAGLKLGGQGVVLNRKGRK